KPFHLAELAARLRALRRRGRLGAARLEVGDTVLDLARQQVVVGEAKLRLSRTEFDLLRMLAERPGEVFERGAILGEIWGSARYDPNIVDQYVSYVRRKLDAGGSALKIVIALAISVVAGVVIFDRVRSIVDEGEHDLLASIEAPYRTALLTEPTEGLDAPGRGEHIAVIDPAGVTKVE